MNYFSCSGGPGAVSIKSVPGHVTPNLCFLYTEGSAGHVVHSGPSRTRNVIALFFMLDWDMYGYDKKRAKTFYAELMFLEPVGSAGHVVHSNASRARNMVALFFVLERDWYGFDKRCPGTRYTELVFLHSVG
jgi:hypothetical protein